MLLRFLSGSVFNSRLFFDADGGGSGSGTPSGTAGGTSVVDDKKFSQADVDKIVQDRVKSKNRELKQLAKDLEETKRLLADLQEKVKNPAPSGGGNPDHGDAGKLELLEARYQRQIDELNNKISAAEQKALDAEDRRKKTERDKELGDALISVNCIDMIGGRRHCEPQVEWDALEDKWMYRTKSGNLVSIADGVLEELPNYLKPAVMQQGGSGSNGTPPKRAAKKAEADTLRKQIEKLEKEVQVSRGNTTLVTQLSQKKRQLRNIEADLAAG